MFRHQTSLARRITQKTNLGTSTFKVASAGFSQQNHQSDGKSNYTRNLSLLVGASLLSVGLLQHQKQSKMAFADMRAAPRESFQTQEQFDMKEAEEADLNKLKRVRERMDQQGQFGTKHFQDLDGREEQTTYERAPRPDFRQKVMGAAGLEIPKMLMEREAQKKKEYQEREKIDLQNVSGGEFSREEIEEMSEADQAYLFEKRQRSPDDLDEEFERDMDQDIEELIQVKDPYVKKRALKVAHQEYRTVDLGPVDLLKNGQMVQVAVSDAFNKNKFHATDKIILAKHEGTNYAVGSFCGFDFTNLATGALIGEKLICPTCGSNYDIKSGIVDQGPSLRNISSFMIQSRDDVISVVLPEHIPAFQRKKFLKRTKIDPRTIVVIGDSEAALSALDALRTSFTGEIICIPCSPFGAFENKDILTRKFTPLTKNETYYLEEDFLDRANITLIKGKVQNIDLDNKVIQLGGGAGNRIQFDKVLCAWGASKKKLQKQYSNVFYLEDRQSHAQCHNQILKAKQITVLGGTFEAFQTAASIREYLDSIGYTDTQIVVLNDGKSEIHQTLGKKQTDRIIDLMKKQRISVVMDAEIKKLNGETRLDQIIFRKKEHRDLDAEYQQGVVDYYLNPDIIIAENGVGEPKINIHDLIDHKPGGAGDLNNIGIDYSSQMPAANMRFSLLYSDIMSPIYAAGSCTHYPSFMHKIRIRTDDVKYNIESGFFAAMNMLDKEVEFNYLPFSPMKIGDTRVYHVGERKTPFSEIITCGDVDKGKYVNFYVYGDEIVSFVTVGYQNLHLYIWEAMKQLIMPSAAQLRSLDGDFEQIVATVLKLRPDIQAGRSHIIKTPSVIRAEFTREIEDVEKFRGKIRERIADENNRQGQKVRKMKEKYDREGVNFVEDEKEIGREAGQSKAGVTFGQAPQQKPIMIGANKRTIDPESDLGRQLYRPANQMENVDGNNVISKALSIGTNMFAMNQKQQLLKTTLQDDKVEDKKV